MTIPIVPGFHPDPSIVRTGDDYYLVNSTFEYLPGVPIRHSTDMINWTLLGNVLSRPDQMPASKTGGGILAPTIRFHGGRYWMITTDFDRIMDGHLLVSAEDPSGPWTEPVFTTGAVGIDPDIVWTEEGDCYLSWAQFSDDGSRIMQAKLDPRTGRLLSDPLVLTTGLGFANTEGPHLYRKDDWWYLVVAEGGTERGHVVSVARSRSVSGPFEPCPANPILSHRSTMHEVQNTGHGDLVELPSGEWAMVYLGVRLRGVTPGFHVNGRETFLAGIDWVDGWPVVDEKRFGIPDEFTSVDDRFEAPQLDARWVSPERWSGEFASIDPDGGLSLAASAEGTPGVIALRPDAFEWQFEVTVQEGDASLIVRLDDRHWARITPSATAVVAEVHLSGIRHTLGSARRADGTVTLRVRCRRGEGGFMARTGPDVLEFGVVQEGRFVEIASLDGRYLSTEVAGGFTGRVVGIECGLSASRVSRATYSPLEAS